MPRPPNNEEAKVKVNCRIDPKLKKWGIKNGVNFSRLLEEKLEEEKQKMKFASDPRKQNEYVCNYVFYEEGIASKGLRLASWDAIEQDLAEFPRNEEESYLLSFPSPNFYGRAVFLCVPMGAINAFLSSTQKDEYGRRIPKTS